MNYSVITGGSSGLGLEIACMLLEKGKRVIIIGRDERKLQKAMKERFDKISEGKAVIAYAMDIAKEEDVEGFMDFLGNNGIEPEHLFNVAGTHFFGDISQIGMKDIRSVLEANMIGLIQMSIKCSLLMQKDTANRHRIISILSTAALKGKKNESIYNAAKWGARGFLESLRDELSDSNIDIINVFPGGMKTPFWDNSTSGYKISGFMEPADVARYIVDISLEEKLLVSDITINRLK